MGTKVEVRTIPLHGLFIHRKQVWRSLGKLRAESHSTSAQKVFMNEHVPIYIEKGIGNEFDVYPFTDNNVCKPIAYIKYVHQLQHLLFTLGVNSEMEV